MVFNKKIENNQEYIRSFDFVFLDRKIYQALGHVC